MQLYMFSVFDQAAGAYLPPFFLPGVGVAKRTFTDCVQSETHQFGKHPEDYALIELGVFDDQEGKFQIYRTPETLLTGLQAKAKLTVVEDREIA